MLFKPKDYWDARYSEGGDSGYGSYGEQLYKKINWLTGLNIDSIVEIGCGDFNFGSSLVNLYPDATYIGQDISEFIIEQNKTSFPYNKFQTSMDLPSADLVLCIDVLFHVTDDIEYEALLNKLEELFKKGKYLAITAYEEDRPVISPHVKIRKLDYKRFGEPIIRQVVEEDGQLYFYLFRNSSSKPAIDLSKVSCCLITKDKEYPQEVLENLGKYHFGEILIKTESDSPFRKHELFAKAKFDYIYYQDDDSICPVDELVAKFIPDTINLIMKAGHAVMYKDTKMTMGLGWGCLFPKTMLASLKKYTDVYGEDEIYKRETERVFTALNFPQNRIIARVIDLPSAYAEDRLWRQPHHMEWASIAEQRCNEILNK